MADDKIFDYSLKIIIISLVLDFNWNGFSSNIYYRKLLEFEQNFRPWDYIIKNN